MAGKFSFTLQEYKDAARKYRSEFLRLPIIGCEETLKFMTGRPGIRYKESVVRSPLGRSSLLTSPLARQMPT